MPILFDFSQSLVGVSNKRASGAGHIGPDGLYLWDTAHDTLRLNHDLDGTYRGLLVEPKRTNVWKLNHTLNFDGTEINTSASPNGVTSVIPNSEIGIDGEPSAHRITMDQNESRYWFDGTPWASERAVASQYVKRNGDAADLAFGYLVNSTQYPKKFATPASGFERLSYLSPVNMGTDNNGPTIYMGNRRNHPDGANNGPTSLIVCGFQVELVDGSSPAPTSLIWTTGAAVTREADNAVVSPIPVGRYHIRVMGDQGSVIWPAVEVLNGQWVIDTGPIDFEVRSVEFLEVETTTHIDGVPIVKKTIGGVGADYPDLASARAAMPVSLVAANEIWWLVVLPGFYLEAFSVNINAATDARHPVWISSTDYGHAAQNNRQHWWNTRNRTRIDRLTSSALNVGTDYMSVWGLALDGMTMSAATAPGDPAGGTLLARDCLFTGPVNQGSNGGPYTRIVNSHFEGHGFPFMLFASSHMTLAAYHCTAIAGASKSADDTERGIGGTLWNCIAVNYETIRGLNGKLHNCATDASDGSDGLSNLAYADIFKNSFANPELADVSPLLAGGVFHPAAQYDIRGDARPTSGGVDIGMVNKAAVTDLTFAQLAALAKEGKAQPINRNYPSATFGFKPHWDGSGGIADQAFFSGWSAYTVVPSPGQPKIAGGGGGHGTSTMDAARTMFNRLGDHMWERISADREIQVRAKDDPLGPVSKNISSPRHPDNDVTIDGDWVQEPWVPLDTHYYGGAGGNGAVSPNGLYMSMIGGSSWFSSSGGATYGNHVSVLDLTTGYWLESSSGAAGDLIGSSVGNGGKAFVQTDGGNFQWYISTNRVVLKRDLDKDPTTPGSALLTGVGMDSGVWFVFNNAPTGIDGGACYVPGMNKALAWQPDDEANGTTYAWVDVSGTNPVVTPLVPTGDLPNHFHLDGATGVWHATDQAIYLYTGDLLYRFDPVAEHFTNVTPSQLGADLVPFPALSPANASKKAVLGYLPDEDVLIMSAGPNDDTWLYDPIEQVSVRVPAAMLLGL